MLSLGPGYLPPSRQPIDTSWNIAWQYLPCTMYTALYTDLSKINIVFWPHFITLYSYFIVSGKYQFGKILSNSHIHICVHVKSKLHWNCRTFSSDHFHVTTRHNMLAEVAFGHGLKHVQRPPAPLTLSTCWIVLLILARLRKCHYQWSERLGSCQKPRRKTTDPC